MLNTSPTLLGKEGRQWVAMSSGFKKLGIQSERSRWPALAAKMSAVGLSVKENRTLTLKQKVDRWYVHSGILNVKDM